MSENRNLLDDHIQRTVARSALHRIHDIIEEDVHEERRGIRFAGIWSGIAFGVICTAGVAGAVISVLTGRSSQPGPLLLSVLVCLAVVAAVSFIAAHYFGKTYPRAFRRHGIVSAIAVLAAAGGVLLFFGIPVAQ